MVTVIFQILRLYITCPNDENEFSALHTHNCYIRAERLSPSLLPRLSFGIFFFFFGIMFPWPLHPSEMDFPWKFWDKEDEAPRHRNTCPVNLLLFPAAFTAFPGQISNHNKHLMISN